jgi:hypothetical protein
MLNAKQYGQARALVNESPLLVALDVSIAALREGLALSAPVTRQARRQGLHHYVRLRQRLNRARLRRQSGEQP